MQRALADANDQLQKASQESALKAEENDRQLQQIGNLEEALKASSVALDAAIVNAATAANPSFQQKDNFLKQIADLSQQLSDSEAVNNATELSKNQTRLLAQQLQEVRNQADATSKLVKQLAQQSEDVKSQSEDANNHVESANHLAESIAANLSKQLKDALNYGAECLRQLEGARTEAEAASDSAEKVEALTKDLEGERNRADELKNLFKDAQTQVEIADALANNANAELTSLLGNVRQLRYSKAQSEAAIAHAEGNYKTLSKQYENVRIEAEIGTSEAQGLRKKFEAAKRLAESAGQALAGNIEESRRQVEAATSHAQNVAADTREIFSGDHVLISVIQLDDPCFILRYAILSNPISALPTLYDRQV